MNYPPELMFCADAVKDSWEDVIQSGYSQRKLLRSIMAAPDC